MAKSRLMMTVVCVCLFSVAVAMGGQMAPRARVVLQKAKKATGGAAWDALRASHSKATVATGGLTGTAEVWEDLIRGRFADAYRIGPASGADGFDGTVLWSQDTSKQVRREQGGEARLAAMNEAYRRVMGYWYPERWPSTIEYSGMKREGGRSFHVLRISPAGGRPYDLWVDAATNLFDRTVEKASIETRTTIFSDFRTVDGVKVPFHVHSTNGEEKYDQDSTVETLEFNPPIAEARYAMPAPPPPDFALAAGRTSITVPFELENNHIYVNVKLDGQGPFHFLCDTGGANVVTPEIAARLGLKSEGALQGRGVGEKSEDVAITKIGRLEIGEATLNDQLFAVFPLGSLSRVEGVACDGLVGYEVFKRFVVKVDYEGKELTLTLPSAFTYTGTGVVVPFKFNEHIPQVEGEIDGIPGKMDIDTGSRASLDLLAPFVAKHGLKAHYAPKFEATTGYGFGGAARSLVTRAGVLKLGGIEVKNVVTELSTQKKGAFTDPYVAGNVGAGVLKRFNITFDYGKQRLIFERNANDAQADVYDRSGMWINLGTDGFEVMDVVPGGPADTAGLRVGDTITAIDGRPAAGLSLPATRVRLKTEAPGSKLRLTVRSGESNRETTLILRDLV
jgi:hypothetical protein